MPNHIACRLISQEAIEECQKYKSDEKSSAISTDPLSPQIFAILYLFNLHNHPLLHNHRAESDCYVSQSRFLSGACSSIDCSMLFFHTKFLARGHTRHELQGSSIPVPVPRRSIFFHVSLQVILPELQCMYMRNITHFEQATNAQQPFSGAPG